MAARDIKIEDDELFINAVTGDFDIVESDTQHVKDIISSWAGWWKEFPTLGVGVKQYLGRSANIQMIKRAIQINLKADGYRPQDISVKNNQVFVTGTRIKEV